MKPITPVLPGVELPITTYAKDQPEYRQLPAFVTKDGVVVSRWRLTFRERVRILFTGDLWHASMTFKQGLQPTKMSTRCLLNSVGHEPDCSGCTGRWKSLRTWWGR